MPLLIPASWGELFDKITILEIKTKHINTEAKLKNIRKELSQLSSIVKEAKLINPGLNKLIVELKTVNEQLWEIEDKIRACEDNQDFKADFIQLARSVYITNDKRAQLKYQLNQMLNSDLVEEKSYKSYSLPDSK